MKYYVIADFPDRENMIHPVEDRQTAETVAGTVAQQITGILNPAHLKVTQKEDDTIIVWNGDRLVTLSIRGDDEVDVSFLDEQ